MSGVEARLREEYKRIYKDIDPTAWYQVMPIFPGVTQRMVNMAGERLARLATPRGFVTMRADHLEFRSAAVGSKTHASA
jgi:3-hydroxymyristoyl/3-hydroxydecanoyl-(acyl carrier protein) dehydratase